jgi:hypothetical protein
MMYISCHPRTETIRTSPVISNHDFWKQQSHKWHYTWKPALQFLCFTMLNMNYDTPNKNTLFEIFQYDTSADNLSNDTNICHE